MDLSDGRAENSPMVMLKDGTEIRLRGDLVPLDWEEDGKLIPLDEVDHLVLMDGTVLYPVTE